MHPDEVQRLSAALRSEADASEAEVVETHISWVLLVGDEAYKIKKPVDLGFVDFSSLARRRHFCEEELRLNRRLAPHLYLDVVSICGSPDEPRLDGDGEPFEYAVRMQRFPQESLLSAVVARGELTTAHVERFAETLAEFHARIPAADASSPYGTPEAAWSPVEANFSFLIPAADDDDHRRRLESLLAWSRHEFESHQADFEGRRRGGFVRECHGDAHLGNALLESTESGVERVILFDGIDFSPELRWIDVLCDAAFAIMDLADRGRPDFANRFLGTYLQRTGDYAGLGVLTYYLVYRSLVRAKVACIRRAQSDVDDAAVARLTSELEGYLTLAEEYARPREPRLLVTTGFSGSGKSTIAQRAVDEVGAVRIRSDVERKRLAARSDVPPGDLYAASTTDLTYATLRDLASAVVRSGFTVVVDATFLERRRRDAFRELAGELGVPFTIVHVVADVATLRERVALRTRAGVDVSDANVAVLERQLEHFEPFGAEEASNVVEVDSTDPESTEAFIASLRSSRRSAESASGGPA